MFSAPISSTISTVDPSAVANNKHPFIRNFMLPVPDASCPAVLQKDGTLYKKVIEKHAFSSYGKTIYIHENRKETHRCPT